MRIIFAEKFIAVGIRLLLVVPVGLKDEMGIPLEVKGQSDFVMIVQELCWCYVQLWEGHQAKLTELAEVSHPVGYVMGVDGMIQVDQHVKLSAKMHVFSAWWEDIQDSDWTTVFSEIMIFTVMWVLWDVF